MTGRRRLRAHDHPVNRAHHDEAPLGARVAEAVIAFMGSWRFIIVQTAIVASWVLGNAVLIATDRWDPYPFILLNLLFSTQAAYAAPLILLAGNRQAARDRDLAEHDYQVNVDAEGLLHKLESDLAVNTHLTRELLARLGGGAA